MEKAGGEKRGGDVMECEEEPSRRKVFVVQGSSSSTLPPISRPPLLQPNWGDNPSPRGLKLMKLALEKFNRDWAQAVKDKPDTNARAQFAFVGGLHISSFINEGVWCHLNFKTNKVDVVDPVFKDHGPYLFFAELFLSLDKSEYEVKSVFNFGPVKHSYNAKLGGCKACDCAQHRDIMMHPVKGFNKGCTPHYEVTNSYLSLMREEETFSELQKDFHDDNPSVSPYLAMMRERETLFELVKAFKDDHPAVVDGELSNKLGQLSLEYYNEAARNNQELECTFIKKKCCTTFRWTNVGCRWFHLNYVACDELRGEELLFFAEVVLHYGTRRVEVLNCQLLGLASHVAPKLDGCLGCDMTPCRSEIVHPTDGVDNRASFLFY